MDHFLRAERCGLCGVIHLLLPGPQVLRAQQDLPGDDDRANRRNHACRFPHGGSRRRTARAGSRVRCRCDLSHPGLNRRGGTDRGQTVNKIVVVGSGVSGAHATLTLLERGHDVELWDVGREEPTFPMQGATFPELKDLLRYPPSREFLTSSEDSLWNLTSDSFFAYGSFAKGGLANGWGANALAFDDNDLAEWAASFSAMEAALKPVTEGV